MNEKLKARLAQIDRGLLLVALIATIAALPLFTRPSLPTLTDAEMHIYRAAVIESAVRNGEFYIRWAPDFYYGHGYPVFNYYSPLSYHIAAYFSIFTGTNAVAGTKFVLLLTIYLGAFGMYLFARDRWRSESGLIASTAWVFAPYILYIDPYGRGDVPQALALAIGPALFWSFDRLRRTGAWHYLALAAVLLGALILSHPLMALALYGLLLLVLGWSIIVAPNVPRLQTDVDRTPVRAYSLLVAGITLGLLLAAMYWLPTGLERGAVKLTNVAGPGFFDFRNHFLSVGQLLGPSPIFDHGATESDFRFNFGVAQWVLALAGFLTVFVRRLRRIDTIFFAFMSVMWGYMMIPASLGVWETVPLMSFFQFPSRFLGPAALVMAPLAGASLKWTELIKNDWARRLYTPTAIMFILVMALPLTVPRPWDDFGAITPLRMVKVELEGRALGTTSADDFLPASVTVIPGPQKPVIDQYLEEVSPVDKLNRATLPANAEVTLLASGAQYDIYRSVSDEDYIMRLFRFDFPGWTARIDGEIVPIEPAEPDGFITFPVPAGTHEVNIRLEMTPARILGWILTISGLLGVVGVTVVAVRRWKRRPTTTDPESRLGTHTFVAVLITLALFTTIKLVGDSQSWFSVRSTGDTVLVAQYQHVVPVGSQFRFLGFDYSSPTVRRGTEMVVTLYWRAINHPSINYQVFIHFIDENGVLQAQSDALNPAGFPTSRWPLDFYVRDRQRVRIPGDIPAGTYTVQVGLWNAATEQRLPVLLPDGSYAPDSVIVLPVKVEIR